MQKLRTEITSVLSKELGHGKTLDAFLEAEDRFNDELNQVGRGNEAARRLIEATQNYDKFIFKFYLNRIIKLLQ